jgi:predicted alpha/beta-hydrolase family hydrolase
MTAMGTGVHPGRSQPAGALLFPGAGSSRAHHTLTALAEALAPLPVGRADFPYRKAGRRAPDRPPVLLATVRQEAADLAAELGVGSECLLLGGRSMGGRIASMAVAEGLVAWGLVLISYPLHPPGRPERLRTEHFPAIRVPTLFVSGTRDTFGTVEELESATRAISGPVTHVWIENGRHELDRVDPRIVAAVQQWLAGQTGAG